MRVSAWIEQVAMARPIVVSRGAYAEHDIVVVRVEDGVHEGRGECCAIAHYGLSATQTIREIEAVAVDLVAGLTREELLARMPPGPARNGLDCALWDLEAKRKGVSAWKIAGMSQPKTIETAMTLMMARPGDMATQALRWADFKTLKLKLGRVSPAESLHAVRAARPDARLSLDANEAWTPAELEKLYPAFVACGLEMIEQPLAAAADAALAVMRSPAPFCADESFHSSADLESVAGRYGYINIKLDKCGGLTEALRIIDTAPRYGLRCMVGCMFATSLGMAPALIAASLCDFADLDGPLHLAADRPGGYLIAGGAYHTGTSNLWGTPS